MTDAERIEKALFMAEHYGGVNGGHHKMWVIDQLVRCLTGCPTERREGIGADGEIYIYTVLGESDEYRAFIARHNEGEDGPDSYTWDEGIAP